MAKRFVNYDWDFGTYDKKDEDDVQMMLKTDEEQDGNFIWSGVVGGFEVYDTWTDLEIAKNQK